MEGYRNVKDEVLFGRRRLQLGAFETQSFVAEYAIACKHLRVKRPPKLSLFLAAPGFPSAIGEKNVCVAKHGPPDSPRTTTIVRFLGVGGTL